MNVFYTLNNEAHRAQALPVYAVFTIAVYHLQHRSLFSRKNAPCIRYSKQRDTRARQTHSVLLIAQSGANLLRVDS
jgi:hypothetical protein